MNHPQEARTTSAAKPTDQTNGLDAANAEAPGGAPGEDSAVCTDLPLGARIEAMLLSTDRPMTETRLAELLGVNDKGAAKTVEAAIEQLNTEYKQTDRSFRAQRLAGGWQLLTTPDFAPLLARLHQRRQETRLSPAALETLAIIAYRSARGGIMRAEIEAIRGVACGDVLRGLLERRMIKIVGRAEQLGRPMLYGTSTQFLKVFGLPGLDALPPVEGAEAAEPAQGSGEQAPPAGC